MFCKNIFLLLFVLLGVVLAQQYQNVTELGKPFRFEHASAEQWSYYKLNVETLLSGMGATDSVNFIATPYSGDVDLYISANHFPARRDCTDCWKSTSPHGDIVTIARNDARWPSTFFYIGVYSASRSRFTFNTFLKSTHITLLDGEAQSASCTGGKPTYFEFHLDDDSDFSIAASPVNGDPDLVVSVDIREPNSTLYDWKADRWGFDVLNIEKTHPKYRANSVYNVGVYAFPESMFTIAATKPNSYTTIVEGVPLSQTVERKQYKYFKFFMEENNFDLVFSATTLSSSGDPDLYVTYNRERPNATNYDYRANVPGSDSIFIKEAKSGIYYVAVHGFSACEFQIVANTEFKSILLTEGMPWRGFLEAQKYGYFKFFHGDYESGLSISMNLINGDADMYISTINTRPIAEAGKHEYVGTKVSNNLFWYLPPPSSGGTPKYVYVGIFPKTNVSYSMIAQTNQSYSILRDAELNYWNHVSKGYYRYFLYDLIDPTKDISVSVNPWDGETSVFVSVLNTRPTLNNYTWGSMRFKQDTVVITGGDAKKQGKTRFYIGVYGNMDSQFSITAFMSNSSTITLSDGIPIAGGVVAGKYNFYKYWVASVSSLTINLELQNPSTTDADLYASYVNEKPSQLDHQYKGEKYGNEFVRIQEAHVGWIYIGVYGFYSSSPSITIQYTISASMASQIISTNRADLLSFALANQFKLYHAFVPTSCEFVVLSTTTVYGKTDLYVSSNETGLSMTNYLASSNTHPSNLLLIKKNNPGYKEGFWSLGVHARQDSDFFISAVCGGPNNFIWLQEGIPKFSLVPTAGTLMFLFSVDWLSPGSQNLGNYIVSIRPMRGTLSIEMYNLLDITGPRWNASGSNYHEFKLEKGTIRTGVYVIAIVGTVPREFETVFELNLRRDGTPVLLNKDSMHIQTSSPTPDSFTYYRVLNSFTNQHPLYTFVESCSTEAAPVVYCDPKNPKPNQDAPYKSLAIHKFMQELLVDNTTDTRDIPMWNLGIQGNNYAVYSTIMADARPRITNRIFNGQDVNKERLKLTVPRARAPGSWADSNITYYVYTSPLPNGPPSGPFNFFTSCSLITSGNRHRAMIKPGKPDSEEVELEVVFGSSFDKSIGHLINVLATNGLGLSRPYAPGYYVYGTVWDKWPSSSFSIGFIIIFICALIVALYLLIGVIINLIRGKRGLEVIPNSAFWKQLPFFIWEGAVALFCCKFCKGRDTDGHAQLVEEETSSAIINSEPYAGSTPRGDDVTKPAVDEHVEISLAPRGGYGSI